MVCGFGFAWHLLLCCGSLRVVRAARACGTRCCCCLAPVRVPWLWPAACLSGVPGAPAWCAAPRPVWSLSVLRSAFPTPWCLSPPRGLAPPALLGGFAGHAEAGREPGSLCLPLAPAEAGALGSVRVVPVRGPALGLSLAGPSGVGLGLRVLRWCACVDPVTDASGFPYRPSLKGALGRCTGAVSFGRRHLPFRVGGRHARVPCVCACAWFLGRVGRAGLLGSFWCASPFPVAVLGALFVCSAPSGLGLPCLWLFLCFFFLFFSPPLSLAFRVFGPWVPWALAFSAPCPSPVFFSFFSLPPLHVFFLPVFVFFTFPSFFFLAVPWCPGCAVLCAGGSWAVGRDRVCCCGPCALAGAAVRLCSVVWCSLPVPLPFVLLLVVLRVPGGTVLAALLFPVLPLVGAVWCCRPPPPRVFCAGFFFSLVLRLLVVPPPPPPPPPRLVVVSSVVLCRASCRVVLRSVVCFVLYGVLALGWVLAPCCSAPCRAGSCFGCACCRALLRSLLVFFSVVPCLSVVLRAVSVSVLCLCGAVLVCLRRCPLYGALLPLLRWLVCCCLLCSPVCCWAWLSSAVSQWVLVAPGVVFRWCAVFCPWVLRCVVLLRVVPPGVVLLCAVLLRFALFGAVARCVVSWGAIRRPGVLCLPALRFCLFSPRCVCSAVVCCCVVLFAVVLCDVCVLGCPAVLSLSFPPCAVLLCGPALPWYPAPLCCALWYCGAVWCCGVLCCCLVLVCFLCLFRFSYLKNHCKIC